MMLKFGVNLEKAHFQKSLLGSTASCFHEENYTTKFVNLVVGKGH